GAHQVVHGGVDNGEILGLAVLQVFHPRKQHTGIAHQRASGFQNDLQVVQFVLLERLEDLVQQIAGRERFFVGIAYAYAAAQVQVLQAYAMAGQGFDQHDQLVQCVKIGADFGNLGADVAVQPDDVQAGQCGGELVNLNGMFNGNAELVFFQACGNIGMGLCIDIGID